MVYRRLSAASPPPSAITGKLMTTLPGPLICTPQPRDDAPSLRAGPGGKLGRGVEILAGQRL